MAFFDFVHILAESQCVFRHKKESLFMKNHSYLSMQQDTPDQGRLQVTVQDGANNRPVENARVRISYTGVPDNVIEEVRTDSSGKHRCWIWQLLRWNIV